jgi:hypothetical protein
MLKKIILFCLLVLPGLANAQLVLNAQLPAAGFVQKEQLWNLILVNNKEDILDVRIQMNLQDAATGQVVLSANTGNILLSKGLKVISANDLQPILYNYNSPDLSGKYLPMGAYVACYQVSNNIGEERPLVQECIRINIDPLSPPLLNTPADKSEIENPYPQFTWMPPSPYDMFTDLEYELIVTEVLEGQSAVEAIQYNTPVYAKSGITQPYDSYASSFSQLETDKTYAWQVVAKNGLNYAAKTDVWSFRVKKPSPVEQIVSQTPFIKMKRENPEKGIAPNGILKLSYTNETTDTIVSIQILNLNNRDRQPIVVSVHVDRGENLLQKDLQRILAAKEGELYEAYIINSRNEKWRMLFEIRQYKDKTTQRN